MTEWRLYPDSDLPHVSTAEFHAHRARAPHLEQDGHRERLLRAADFVMEGVAIVNTHWSWNVGAQVVDLGCGDGGLLSLLKGKPGIYGSWGYDFAPANREGWAERGVEAYAKDVFNGDRSRTLLGDVVVMTEVLEHLADPHGVLKWLFEAEVPDVVVASSPYLETAASHDECHAWAWDDEGFSKLFSDLGYAVQWHEHVSGAQLILAVKPYMLEEVE